MLRVYDRRATPTNKIGEPTRVVCELFIRSFGSISEKTMVSVVKWRLEMPVIPRGPEPHPTPGRGVGYGGGVLNIFWGIVYWYDVWQ